MRKSKSVGFVVICLGIVLIVGSAVLPVSPATERFGPFRVDIGGDTCGPAAYVATHRGNSVCREAAHRRLLVASAIGLLGVAIGMALFAGGDDPHGSRIEAPSARVRRRAPVRSPGSRGYKPG